MALLSALNDSLLELTQPAYTTYTTYTTYTAHDDYQENHHHLDHHLDGDGDDLGLQTGPIPREWTGGLVAEYLVRNVLSALMVLVNLLVLVTLWTTPSLRRPSSSSPSSAAPAANLVIGSLAVTDLLVGLLGPAGLLIELEVVVSSLMCRMGYATVLALCSVSINHLVFVSVDRYLLISKPLRYQSLVTERRVWIFIGACWAWGGVLSASFLLGLSQQPGWNGRCRAELMYQLWFVICLVILHFLLPFFVMLFVHVNIFIVARRQQRAVKNSLRSLSTDSRGDGGGPEEREVRRPSTTSMTRAKLRAARLLVLPCGYFYLSWGPWFGVVLWAVSTGRTVEPHALERFVQTLAVLNSLGNPILYAVSQPQLGNAMLGKLKALGSFCRRCCVSSAYADKPRPFESVDLVKQSSLRSESTAV